MAVWCLAKVGLCVVCVCTCVYSCSLVSACLRRKKKSLRKLNYIPTIKVICHSTDAIAIGLTMLPDTIDDHIWYDRIEISLNFLNEISISYYVTHFDIALRLSVCVLDCAERTAAVCLVRSKLFVRVCVCTCVFLFAITNIGQSVYFSCVFYRLINCQHQPEHGRKDRSE